MTHPTKICLYHHQDQNREIRRDIFRHFSYPEQYQINTRQIYSVLVEASEAEF